MAESAALKVKILGDSKSLSNALNSSGKSLAKFGGVAAAGAATAGAALVGFGAKAVTSFVDFEQSMNEVFTLLPDISKQGMESMTADLQKFQTEFGVMSDQAIPALYDSLSAGVPQDNVFKFMEDAQKLAVAGNVETAASVDLLTTVVNSYGFEASEAGRVSDVMFSTVKNGKTTIDELGSSLFQVAPIAGQLGVSIESVGASMATLTAQGVPTSVAANSVKAGLAELGKAGSVADKSFQKVAGKTFPEFIASGGDLAGALDILNKAAKEGDTSVTNLFGSVEAGQAFSALATNVDSFESNLEEMRGSAGATQEAFDRMDQGLGKTFDKLKARAEVGFVKVGEKIAPFVDKAIEKFDDYQGHRDHKATACPGDVVYGLLEAGAFKAGSSVPKLSNKSVSSLPMLGLGDKGEAVKDLQNLINLWLGVMMTPYDVLKVDGDFGKLTDKWFRRAQKGLGVNVDGVYGSQSRKAFLKYKADWALVKVP